MKAVRDVRQMNGFTLVEMVISVIILVVLAIISLGAFRPSVLINRGMDARMKKDIARIRASFEDFSTDSENGCYPDETKVRELMDPGNCHSESVFAPWLTPWPCDPTGLPYRIAVPEDACPKWFKVMTKLRDEKDKDIPPEYYTLPGYVVGSGAFAYSKSEVNYGTSSTDRLWYEWVVSRNCETNPYRRAADGTCTNVDYQHGETCQANCFMDPSCSPECQVPSYPY